MLLITRWTTNAGVTRLSGLSDEIVAKVPSAYDLVFGGKFKPEFNSLTLRGLEEMQLQ